jgi:flavin-dependent dehydrogenase
MKPVHIVGAGLAGLALGNALQAANVPVTLFEAGTLPRHRVCGEFICGKGAQALANLGLAKTLEGAATHRNTQWTVGNKIVLHAELPSPAIGISRHLLDIRLATHFENLGGTLLLNHRHRNDGDNEGFVYCNGRKATQSDWIGLKCHCTDLETQSDLELHLGQHGYIGLSAIEDGRVNICALFKKKPQLRAKREDWLQSYLKANGLNAVAERIDDGHVDPASHSGVAGIQFSQLANQQSKKLALGDAYSVIPPFTGNGMSIALESAEIAFEPILKYAKGRATWTATQQHLHTTFATRFNSRLRAARALHPFLSTRWGQHTLASLATIHALPFNFLYRLTH